MRKFPKEWTVFSPFDSKASDISVVQLIIPQMAKLGAQLKLILMKMLFVKDGETVYKDVLTIIQQTRTKFVKLKPGNIVLFLSSTGVKRTISVQLMNLKMANLGVLLPLTLQEKLSMENGTIVVVLVLKIKVLCV